MELDKAIETIKQRVDIVEVVSKYVKLKKIGRNYRGLCPFHAEKTPSFFVNPYLGIYKCFGCQAAGDVIKFVQEIEKIPFIEALDRLAKEAGITIERSKQNTAVTRYKKQLLDSLNKFSKAFELALYSPQAKHALNYLTNQRKLNKETIKTFRIGYAPLDKDFIPSIAQKLKITDQQLLDLGLINQEHKPKFVNRIMFPIFDITGKIVGFSGRTLSKNPNVAKYLNSPESPVFHKRQLLYSLYHSKRFISQQGLVILTEGQIDAITSYQKDIKNVVAPLGTALTETQLSILKKLTKKVAFAYDNDTAGQTALLRSSALALMQDMIPLKLNIPQKYKDLDEFLREQQDSINILEYTQDLFEFLFNTLQSLQKTDYAEFESQLDTTLTLISLSNKIRQKALLKQLSNLLDISTKTLTQRLDTIKNDPYYKNSITSLTQIPQKIETKTTIEPQETKDPQLLLNVLTGIILQIPIMWLKVPLVNQLLLLAKDTNQPAFSVLNSIHQFWTNHIKKIQKQNPPTEILNFKTWFDKTYGDTFKTEVRNIINQDPIIKDYITELMTLPYFDNYLANKDTVKDITLLTYRLLKPYLSQQLKLALEQENSIKAKNIHKKLQELEEINNKTLNS